MRFWLGVHRPHWLAQASGLFVSHRTLAPYRRLPIAAGEWFLDSGGFTQLSTLGYWAMSVSEYVGAVERYASEIGQLAFAAPMDWMCEPWVVEKTGLSVREHQERTVQNYLDLRGRGPFIPVLQGWAQDDYFRCIGLYEEAGVDLAAEPLIGLGTVCRRQDTRTAEDLVLALSPLRLHGFGVKITGLARYGYLLESADSMAWSFGARMAKPGCEGRVSCGNCLHAALEWRDKVTRIIDGPVQMHLNGVPVMNGGPA